MMKGRSWTPASLQEVGGTSGVGVAFLDETFTAKTAPPTHRLHAKASQAVLKALLPEVGTDIKGQMQPTDGLLEISGYGQRPEHFRNLLRILNSELRLITPRRKFEAQVNPRAELGDQDVEWARSSAFEASKIDVGCAVEVTGSLKTSATPSRAVPALHAITANRVVQRR